MHIFVYGTLMSRQGANHMLNGCSLLGRATTKGKLYNLGWFPGLKEGEGTVHGELYYVPDEIKDRVIERLDGYEGYREGDIHSLYVRQLVEVRTNQADLEDHNYHANTYIINRQVGDGQLIKSGDWLRRGTNDESEVGAEVSEFAEAG